MKFLPLVWAGIWRKPGRAVLTMVSLVSAFVIFGVLQGFSAGLDKLVADSQADVLVTASRIGPFDFLPIADLALLRKTPGVRAATPVVFSGGPFRDPTAFLPAQGIDPDAVRASDDKLAATPAQWAALKATRSGALVPSDDAKLYGFKVGDRIPLTPRAFTNRDGGQAIAVDVVGIYPSDPTDNVFGGIILLNYDYIDLSRATGAGTVNDYVVRIDDPAKAGLRSGAIDAQFANSAHATQTFSLHQLMLASVSSLGDVGLAVRLITGAVFFALLFSVGAVMIQSGRERTAEFAVLKTLGFAAPALVGLTIAGSTTYQSIGVQLASPGDYGRFRDWVMSNPQFNAQVKRLGQYYADQMQQLRTLFDFVGIFVGGVMAVGAVCAALTTLYAAVEARAREIATLRAIGFSSGAVVTSVMLESLALAVPGAALGLALAILAFNGHGIDTAGVAFQATVTPQLAGVGVAVALAIGLVGGLGPAVRVARLEVAEALRAT